MSSVGSVSTTSSYWASWHMAAARKRAAVQWRQCQVQTRRVVKGPVPPIYHTSPISVFHATTGTFVVEYLNQVAEPAGLDPRHPKVLLATEIYDEVQGMVAF